MIITLAQMNEALQLAIDNKDVFTTLILFIVVVPLVWFLLKNLLDTIKESNNKIIE
jgi:type IV secretory pathway TrbL component